MQQFIAKIGKGQKAWKDLTWEEAKQAMRLLVEGQATPAQVGAFLLAMRLKMESVAELAAFTAVAREYVPGLDIPRSLPLVDYPTYAGKRETFHASVGAAVVAAACGAAVLMHGRDALPDRPGTSAVLAQLGIPTELDSKQAAEQIAASGFAYLDLALYHPPVARFLSLRDELGVRNLFNPVAKMLNPGRAPAQVIGISHPPYFEKIAEALKMLQAPRALVLRGVEGDPELSLAAATKALELRDERIVPLTFRAKDLGLPAGSFRDLAGFARGDLDREAMLLQRILSGQVRGPQRDWIVMNAALLLYAAGRASSLMAAAPAAMQAIDSGRAARKLEELRDPATKSHGPAGHESRPANGSAGPRPRPVSGAMTR